MFLVPWIFLFSSEDETYFKHEELFTYCEVSVRDESDVQISEHFEKTNEFIEDNIHRGERRRCIDLTILGGVLVHCKAAVSRSVTTIIAYLMWKQNLSFQSALDLLRTKR